MPSPASPPAEPLPADIRCRIARDFDAAGANRLLAELAMRRAAEPQIFTDRIVRCVVHVAGGDLPTAERALAMASTDPRDLIVWAEYDNKFDARQRDFSAPFADE